MLKKIIVGLVSLLSGCHIDRTGLGVVVREGRASNEIFGLEEKFPVIRVQLEQDLNNKTRAYLRFEGIYGNLHTSQYQVKADLESRFESVGTGIRYFPFSENFSFDFGCEVFNADIEAKGRMSGFNGEVNHEVTGWGLNTGITGEIEIRKNLDLLLSLGYNFTDNESNIGNFDFDGWHAGIGINIKIPAK